MPKQRAVPHEEIFNKIGHLAFWDDEGKLKTKTQDVWKDANAILGDRMTIAAIYLYISRNDKNIVNRIVEKYGIEVHSEEEESNDLDGTNESNWSTHETGGRVPFKSIRTIITIEAKDWKTIEPHIVEYNNESKYKLQPGWTSVIYRSIWRDLKLPCPFAFRTENVSMSDGNYLTVHADCNECGNVFNAYAVQPPETDLVMHVSTYDSRRIIHKKKRQLKGPERDAVGQVLSAGTSTYNFRRKIARETMDFGDKEPADLYSEEVCRKAKQQYNDVQMGVKGFVDPILSIQNLRYDPAYSSFIKEVSLDKFYCIYFSQEQTDLYKRWLKDEKIAHLSVDSTGSMWAPIKRPDGSSIEIQLYQLVVPFCGKILPVCQLVTEKHDAVFISYWLKEWIRHKIPVPQSIVCDFSHALLNACSLAFNEKRLGKYIDDSLKYLLRESDSIIFDPPECLILLDIAHLTKIVAQWSCRAGANTKKDFFVRCIMLLSKASSLDIFLTTVQDVLLVAMSEFSSFDAEHSCTASTQRLLGSMATTALPYASTDEVGETSLPSEFHYDSDSYTFSTMFVNTLLEKTEKLVSPGPIGNANYSPEFLKDFKVLLKYFPIWTNVMPNNRLLVSSSARSEEYFRELKRLSLVDKKKRVDRAIIKHIHNIEGTMRLLRAEHDKRLVTEEQQKRKAYAEKRKGQKAVERKMQKVESDLSPHSSPPVKRRKKVSSNNGYDGAKIDPVINLHPRKKGAKITKAKSAGTRSTRFGRIIMHDGSESDKSESDKENFPHFHSSSSSDYGSRCKKSKSPLREFNPHDSETSPPGSKSEQEPMQTLDETTRSSLEVPILSSTIRDQSSLNPDDVQKLKESDISQDKNSASIHSKYCKSNENSLLDSSLSIVESSSVKDLSADDEEEDLVDENLQADLNGVDDWMGKLSQDQRRKGHYVKPCPDILTLHKRGPNKRKIPFLKNGSICSDVRLNNKSIRLMNTCPFDSLSQSLLIAYREWTDYRRYVDKSNNEFLKFIICLHNTNKPGPQIYKQRASIMGRIKRIEAGQMKCHTNFTSLTRTLLTDEPSCSIEVTCNQCSQVLRKDQSVIEIPFGLIHERGLRKIEEIVNECITRCRKCEKCLSRDLTVRKFPGQHLFIDIEMCMSLKLAVQNGYEEWDGKFTLAQLEKRIKFCGESYKLLAAIEYEGPIDVPLGTFPEEIGHYIAHVERLSGGWSVYNNISRAIKPQKLVSRDLLKRRKIPVLIYVRNKTEF